MSEQQKIQAIYMDLKDSTFGSYTKVKKELDLLGMTTSTEEIEVLHSIVINAKSLKDAVDLSNKLSESEKLKLRNEIKTNYNSEKPRGPYKNGQSVSKLQNGSGIAS